MKNKRIKNLLKTLGLAAAMSALPLKNSYAQMINPYVPANDNGKELLNLNTKTQRDSMVQDFLNKDWVSEIAPSKPSDPFVWDCVNYAMQELTNNYDWGKNINLYNGYSGNNIDSIYANGGTLKDMGKEGLPFMDVLVDIPNTLDDHRQIAILTGDSLEGDPSIWENWNFVEPQFDQINIQPGQAHMPKNCDITIRYIFPKENEIQGRYLSSTPIVSFHVVNGKTTTNYINPDIYTNRSIATDKTSPEVDILSPKADTTFRDNNAVFKYRLKDKNLDLANSYYTFNGEKKSFSDSVGTIPLNSIKGTNNLEVYALDKAGNSKQEKINYIYDEIISDVKVTNDSEEKFYPNPVSETGTFEYLPKGKDFSVRIYNSSGQLEDIVLDKDNDGKMEKDFSNYSSGIYFYKTSTGNSGKIIKE